MAGAFTIIFERVPYAPVRQAQVGTRTPVLASDVADLAAAIAAILEIGDAAAFHEAIEDAFPGSAVEATEHRGRFELRMRQRGLLRPLAASELSVAPCVTCYCRLAGARNSSWFHMPINWWRGWTLKATLS